MPVDLLENLPKRQPRDLLAAPVEASDAQRAYDEALSNVRQKYFADMPDEAWGEYSQKAYGPYSLQELVQNGGLFSFSDEIDSSISSLRGLPGTVTGEGPNIGDAWQDFQALNEARLNLGREREGGIGTAAEVVGGLGSVGGVSGAKAATTLPGAMVQGAKEGAPLAAAFMAGDTQGGLEERAKAAGVGLLGGGLIGAAVPLGLAGMRGAVNAVRGKRVPAPVRNVAKALRRDQIPLDEVPQRLRNAGPDTRVMDLGENVRRQAGGIASVPGRGQQTLTQTVRDRMSPTATRQMVADDLNRSIGTSRPSFAVADDIVKAQKAAAGPLYKAIEGVPVQPTKELNAVLNTPAGKAALNKARRDILNEGKVAPKGLTAELLDLAKQNLDDMYRSLVAKRPNEAGRMRNLAERLRSAVDDQVPAYAKARQAFAGPARVKDALEAGRDVFSTAPTKAVHPDQLRDRMAQFTQSEREAFIQGAQSAVQDMMGTARNNPAQMRRLFETGYNADKLEILFGPDAAQQVMRDLERYGARSETAHSVLGGSKTAATQAAQNEVAPKSRSMAGGDTIWGDTKRVASALLQRGAEARQEGVNAQMARILMSGADSIDPMVAEQLARLKGGNPVWRLPAGGAGPIVEALLSARERPVARLPR